MEEIFGIIPLDNEVIGTPILWRELRGKGETVDERDLIIGATSISRKLPLWTKNEKHFSKLKERGLILWKK